MNHAKEFVNRILKFGGKPTEIDLPQDGNGITIKVDMVTNALNIEDLLSKDNKISGANYLQIHLLVMSIYMYQI